MSFSFKELSQDLERLRLPGPGGLETEDGLGRGCNGKEEDEMDGGRFIGGGSRKGCGMRIISLRVFWMAASKVDHVFRRRASKPQPWNPSRISMSTNTPLPHPISTKPGNGGSDEVAVSE